MSVSDVHVLGCINGLCYIVLGKGNGFLHRVSLRELGGDGGGECAARAVQVLAFNFGGGIAEASGFSGIIKDVAHLSALQVPTLDEDGTVVRLA